MRSKFISTALVACTMVLGASLSARAGDCCNGTPAPAPAPAPCGPAMTTVQVEEWVPEKYESTQTVYKTEKVLEKYTAYKCEMVPEIRTRTVHFTEQVPVVENRTRTVCVSVPTVEKRIEMEKHVVCKPVTTYKKKVVDQGHWECREVPCGPSLMERLGKLCKKNDCCEPCDPCPKTKTKKVWVANKVCIEEPVTTMEKTCEYRPVEKMVTVCKTETRIENYTVTVLKCVPKTKTESYTVHVEKKTPYEATREVCKTVPVQEKVTCTRMVKRIVEKQVAVCDPCCTPCEPCCKKPSFLSKLMGMGCCK